jgi:hypothetical protein
MHQGQPFLCFARWHLHQMPAILPTQLLALVSLNLDLDEIVGLIWLDPNRTGG